MSDVLHEAPTFPQHTLQLDSVLETANVVLKAFVLSTVLFYFYFFHSHFISFIILREKGIHCLLLQALFSSLTCRIPFHVCHDRILTGGFATEVTEYILPACKLFLEEDTIPPLYCGITVTQITAFSFLQVHPNFLKHCDIRDIQESSHSLD